MKFPIKKFDKIYHVGEMDVKKKKKGSLEGAGISFSLHPNEWMSIASLGGEIIELVKRDNKFLDYYELTKEQKENITKWGIENHYIKEGTLYEVEFMIEDEPCVSLYKTLEEALNEAEDEEYINEKKGIIPTELMIKKTMQYDESLVNAHSLLTTLYVDENTELDGIWWEEELDLHFLSAPRGVISPSKIKEWKIKSRY